MPSLTSYYSSCSTTVPHPGVHPLFCLMGTISSQQWKFVRQKDSHYGSELPATILTTCVWLLPSCSSYHTMSAAPTIARKYSNFGRGCLCPIVIPQGILFPYADESYTPTVHYANLSNECSTPERMPREFCRNSKMHPS